MRTRRVRLAHGVAGGLLLAITGLPAITGLAAAGPKVIVISLDGATPRLVDQFMAEGALGPDRGLGRLQATGLRADRNVTISPSLTAPSHLAIATGSTPARHG